MQHTINSRGLEIPPIRLAVKRFASLREPNGIVERVVVSQSGMHGISLAIGDIPQLVAALQALAGEH